MNLQLVLCVEANRKAQTDNIYIKQTISRFYNIGNNVRLTFINMGGKSNFKAPDVKRQVKQYCQDYKIGATVVLLRNMKAIESILMCRCFWRVRST